MSTKQLPTAAVVSVATGRLACDMGQIYDVLDWILDDSLMTHQLPNASRTVQPFLHSTFPWLAQLDLPKGGGTNFTEAVFATVDQHGPMLDVPQWGDAPWNRHNAMADLDVVAAGRPIQTLDESADDKPDVTVKIVPDVSQVAAAFTRLSASIDTTAFKNLADAFEVDSADRQDRDSK